MAIAPLERRHRGSIAWRCKCDCGNEFEAVAHELRSGHVISCKCAWKGRTGNKKHGHYVNNKPSATLSSWKAMWRRCLDQNVKSFPVYGGAGISICSRWLEPDNKGFENFPADMGPRPDGKTLDRFPDKDGGYEPSNCRWATPKEQRLNARRLNLITAFGSTKALPEWASITGISRAAIRKRIASGLTPERAVTIQRGKISVNVETMSEAE